MKAPIESLELRIAPAGIVSFLYDPVAGVLTLTGDDAPNAFEVFKTGPATWRVEGRPDALGADTLLAADGTKRLDMPKLTRLTIVTNGGNDDFSLRNLSLLSLSVDTGAGDDTVKSSALSVSGAAAFDLGAGVDTVDLGGLTTTIGGRLTVSDVSEGVTFNLGAVAVKVGDIVFNGGTGNDRLSSSEFTTLNIARAIVFDGGSAGLNSVRFGEQGTTTVGRNAAGQSIAFTGGNGVDSISIGGSAVTFRGGIEMNGGGGADELDLDGVRVSVGKTVAGVSLLLDGGAGADQIDLEGASVVLAGSLKMLGGTEADLLDLTNMHRFTATRIEFDGGAGADVFAIEADLLKIAAGIRFDGGDDADSASIEADGTIAGPVELLLGGATSGLQETAIRGESGLAGSLRLLGALTVDATGAAAGADALKLTDVSVAKQIALTLGDGISTVDIDNLTAALAFSLDTRGGADIVQIERDATFGASVFRKTATILLGTGADLLEIGKDSKNNRATFSGLLTADGGEGGDTSNDLLLNNSFIGTGSLLAISIETLVP